MNKIYIDILSYLLFNYLPLYLCIILFIIIYYYFNIYHIINNYFLIHQSIYY